MPISWRRPRRGESREIKEALGLHSLRLTDMTQISGLGISMTVQMECLGTRVLFRSTCRLSIRQAIPSLLRETFRPQVFQMPSKNSWSTPEDTGVGRRAPGANIQARTNKRMTQTETRQTEVRPHKWTPTMRGLTPRRPSQRMLSSTQAPRIRDSPLIPVNCFWPLLL
jgi:hypothetical protein